MDWQIHVQMGTLLKPVEHEGASRCHDLGRVDVERKKGSRIDGSRLEVPSTFKVFNCKKNSGALKEPSHIILKI